MKDDSRVPITQAEFLERAWKLANDKARALGWIRVEKRPHDQQRARGTNRGRLVLTLT